MRIHPSLPTDAGGSSFHAATVDQPRKRPVTLLGLLVEAQAQFESRGQGASASLTRAIALLRQEANETSSCTGAARGGGLAQWQVQRVTAYIDEHLDGTVRTSQLADLLGLSVSHFSHVFKQTLGIPPLAYVARRRIEAARDMMLRTDEPLTRIAHLHGFCDQSHFTRTFRRETGMAPQVWRRNRSA